VLIGHQLRPTLGDARLIGDVAVVKVAARDTRGLVTIGLWGAIAM
jgi:hypothetical protein